MGDVSHVEAGGGHLVKEGLEGVVVVLVDKEDFDLGLAEGLGGGETTEAGADDNDLGLDVHGDLLA